MKIQRIGKRKPSNEGYSPLLRQGGTLSEVGLTEPAESVIVKAYEGAVRPRELVRPVKSGFEIAIPPFGVVMHGS